jgi:hypothetical protein
MEETLTETSDHAKPWVGWTRKDRGSAWRPLVRGRTRSQACQSLLTKVGRRSIYDPLEMMVLAEGKTPSAGGNGHGT